MQPTNPFVIDGVIHKLKKPVCAYVYDMDHLHQRIRWICDQLPHQVKFLYAMKANPDIPVLSTMASVVDGVEVASLGEIQILQSMGWEKPIAFGGPSKSDVELLGAIDGNVDLYHIESITQLLRLNFLTIKKHKKVNVLLRVNPTFDLPKTRLMMAGPNTQFGIDQEQIPKVISVIKGLRGVELKGFHFHAVSNSLDHCVHLSVVENYIKLCLHWSKTYAIDVQVLNIGGGIGVDYETGQVFSWESFCKGLEALIERYAIDFDLVMECGRFVTACCGYYLTEVIDLKENKGGNFSILRGGTHHCRLPASWQVNLPLRVIHQDHWPWDFNRPMFEHVPITFCGELCTPKDVMARSVQVERIQIGDLVTFSMTGAYAWHISHNDFLSHPYPEKYYFIDGHYLTQEAVINDKANHDTPINITSY